MTHSVQAATLVQGAADAAAAATKKIAAMSFMRFRIIPFGSLAYTAPFSTKPGAAGDRESNLPTFRIAPPRRQVGCTAGRISKLRAGAVAAPSFVLPDRA